MLAARLGRSRPPPLAHRTRDRTPRSLAIARAAVEETARRRSAAAAVPHVVQMMNIEVTYTEFVEILCRVGRTASKGVVGREEAPLDIQLQFWLGEVETRISGSYGDEVVA